MTSSKAKKSVIGFSRIKPRFHLTLDFTGEPSITIKGSKRYWIYGWIPRHLHPTGHSIYNFHSIYKVSENPMKDCIIWYDRVNGVLGRRINKANVWIINEKRTDWLKSQQETIEDVSIFDCGYQDVEYFLNSIKITGSLNIALGYNNNQLRMEIPEDTTNLSIRNASFIGYEQFMRLKHQNIILHGSILTNQDINEFLKSWMLSESHLHLKSLKIIVLGPPTMDVIMELPFQWTTDSNLITKFAG
uniref:FBA_2 domain-containing protein n=1 Tax=Caenorhabditis tropicalis TaxID=1561998 RepID=A0A1I7TH98_9PELO